MGKGKEGLKKKREMEGGNNFGGIIKHQRMFHCLLAVSLKGHIDYVFCCNGHLYLPHKHPPQSPFLPLFLID